MIVGSREITVAMWALRLAQGEIDLAVAAHIAMKSVDARKWIAQTIFSVLSGSSPPETPPPATSTRVLPRKTAASA